MLKRVLALLVAATLLAGLLIYSQYRPEPLKVSGFIEADEIRVGSRVGGRVASVHVEEGTQVSPGAVLVKLEPFDLQDRLAQAVAERAARKAEYEKLAAGFRQEEIAQAKAQLDQATNTGHGRKRSPRAGRRCGWPTRSSKRPKPSSRALLRSSKRGLSRVRCTNKLSRISAWPRRPSTPARPNWTHY
jgi:hypothetical protein